MTTPTTDNQTASIIDSIISGAENGLVKMVEGMAIADVPWLGLPIIKQIWEALLCWIAGYFSKAAQTLATFTVIDAQVSNEQTGLSQALQNLINAEKSGNAAAIQIAIQAYANAQSALANDNGSATPQ